MNIEKLKEKIKKIEYIHGRSLHFESAKKLIEKIQEEYRPHMSGEKFKNLVRGCAIELELHYNYCRVAFAYLSGNKEEKKDVPKSNSTEDRQKVFSLENKVFL